MWLKRSEEQWAYRFDNNEIAIINWVSWAEIYEALLMVNDLKGTICDKIYDKDLDILKLKCSIKAKEVGWDITEVL